MDIMNTPYPKPAMQLDNTPYPFAQPDRIVPSVQPADVPPTSGESIGMDMSSIQSDRAAQQYGLPAMTTGAMAGMSSVPAFDAEPAANTSALSQR